MPSRETIVARVKKLRALAASDNENEAASAKEEAAKLVSRHVIREDELVTEVTILAEKDPDDYRTFLCEIATVVHGCTIARRKNQLGFRGSPDCVRRALALYETSLEHYGASLDTLRSTVAWWLREQAEVLWCFAWHDGFAEAVYARSPRAAAIYKRAAAAEAAKKTAAPKEEAVDEEGWTGQRPKTPEDVIGEIRQNAAELAPAVDIQWLCDAAKQAGRAAGTQVPLRVGEAEFSLPATSARK